MDVLRSIAHYGPITGLAFLGEYLLVGEGPRLKKYHWKTGELVHEVKVLNRDKVHGIVVFDGKIISQKKMNDWIMSVALAKGGGTHWAYVQTAHNSVYCITKEMKIADIVKCEEDSVLYSGTILPLENGDALVGAGTVLDGVVMWRLSDKQILQRFKSHEGSIFGVVISQDGKRVISCSDDRSLRLWDLESDKELAVGWGHMGRIWQMVFLDNDYVISISEDTSARLWKHENNQLVCQQVYEGHLGRNTWCGAVQLEAGVLATGGGDGRIRLWDLTRHEQVSAGRIDEQWKDVELIQQGESLRGYDIVENGLITVTSKLRVLIRSSSGQWDVIPNVQVDSQSPVEALYQDNFVCIGCGDGTITEVDVSSKVNLNQRKLEFQARLAYLHLFKRGADVFYLASTANPNDPFYVVKAGTDIVRQLERPSTFHPTCIAYSCSNNVLYMGSRHGALVAYNFDGDSPTTPIANCWRRLVSEETITSITPTQSSGVHITTRDGDYCLFQLNPDYTMNMLNTSSTPKGAIMGCKVIDNRLMLYGFRNKLFFVWDDTLKCEIMSEECGGMHRAWRFHMSDTDPYNHQFAYYKTGCLHMVNGIGNSKFSQTVVQMGTHGREIRAVEFAQHKLDDGSLMLATASEDTCVRFCTLTPTGELKTHVIQRKHVSGMQAVHWTPDGRFLLSSAANEELYVWKVTPMSNGEVFACVHSQLPTSTDIPDLRIMDFAMLELSGSQYILATVYSDSAIKLWLMDTAAATFQMLASGGYTSCCLINCRFVVHDSQTFLIIGATNGHLIVYNVTSALQGGEFPTSPTVQAQLHQSSVKGVAMIPNKGNDKYLHVSGGDDNALVSCELDLGRGTIDVQRRVEDAHIATITSVVHTPQGFVSGSVDQNMSLWDSQLNLLESKYTTVADLGTMDAHGSTIAFAGSGMSFWSLRTS